MSHRNKLKFINYPRSCEMFSETIPFIGAKVSLEQFAGTRVVEDIIFMYESDGRVKEIQIHIS